MKIKILSPRLPGGISIEPQVSKEPSVKTSDVSYGPHFAQREAETLDWKGTCPGAPKIGLGLLATRRGADKCRILEEHPDKWQRQQ